jgi:hypothetical protein
MDSSVRTQQDIYDDLRARVSQKCATQNPVLYGNKDLRFFGPLVSVATASFPITRGEGVSLCLQGGEAHGLHVGDTFTLQPFYSTASGPPTQPVVARISKTAAFTAELEILGQSFETGRLTTGWKALVLTRTALQRYPVRISVASVLQTQWQQGLKKRSLQLTSSHTLNEPYSFEILENGNRYEVRDGSNRAVTYLPTISIGSVDDILDIVAHVARFEHVRSISNVQPGIAFQKSFQVQVVTSTGEKFGTGHEIKVTHDDIVVLEIRNHGGSDYYAHIYDLGPTWQVENCFRASHHTIPGRDSRSATSGVVRKKIRMSVPSDMLANGLEQCVDVIKVFITTKPTNFATLEMPKVGASRKMDAASAPTTAVLTSGSQSEISDDWLALNFELHTVRKAEAKTSELVASI